MSSLSSLLASWSKRQTAVIFLLVSALYFIDTCLRASLKTFWFDELFTVYLCRLPTFHATWVAVMRGSDFNPPLFYLLTRWSESLFGEGLIATRLPAIIGFWIFGVCLYAFVSRRLNRTAGCIAALFPFFTLAHYYSYEARAHGVVLAFSGLMLVCWQRARERSRVSLWLLGLFLSFLAALLTHIYAVYLIIPFLAAEGYSLLRERRLHLGALIVVLLAPACVLPLYLRMVHEYKTLTPLGGLPTHLYVVAQQYLVSLFAPALVILLLFLVLFAWECRQVPTVGNAPMASSLSSAEMALAVGFALIPVFGIIGVRMSHGPFFDRYFLTAIAGYAILLGQASAFRGGRNLAARGVVLVMFLMLLASTVISVRYHRRHSDLAQVEPSSHFAFSSSPAVPLEHNSHLLRDTSSRDILVTAEPVFLYLHYYAPPELRRRLVFGAPEPNGMFLRSYRRLVATGIDLRTATFSEFFATHDDFLTYGSSDGLLNGTCLDCTEDFLKAGYVLRSVDQDDHNVLRHFSRQVSP